MNRGDGGSATVLASAFLAVLMLVGAALGVVGALVHGHRQAQSAADLAALAGAGAIGAGRDACGAAARIAELNGAALIGCTVDGREVRVEVTVSGPHWLGQDEDLTAVARAGPEA